MSTLPASVSVPSEKAAPAFPTPVLHRRSGGRIVGGVAGGIADHLQVEVFRVRLVFAILSAMAGAGIAAYGLLWIFTPAGSDVRKAEGTERRRAIGLAAIGVGAAIALGWGLTGSPSSVIVPLVVVAIGATLVWREFDTAGVDSAESGLGASGARLTSRPAGRATVLGWARIVAGVTLVVIGLFVVVLSRVDMRALQSSLLAVVVTVIGAVLLTVPLWMRLWRALGDERAARVRNEEREDIASHLHDSVLQTLALIQKQSTDSAAVARLARSQERELRRWLFGGGDADHASLTRALATIAGEVEDHYGVTVDPVTVGDVALDESPRTSGLSREAATALLGATREALVNAAKHSGVSTVDLFAEASADSVEVFVRDRGCGFDVDAVADDRQGLAKSVRARIERRGGEVEVRSSPGRGTEVRLRLPRARADDSEPGTEPGTEPDAGTDRREKEDHSA